MWLAMRRESIVLQRTMMIKLKKSKFWQWFLQLSDFKSLFIGQVGVHPILSNVCQPVSPINNMVEMLTAKSNNPDEVEGLFLVSGHYIPQDWLASNGPFKLDKPDQFKCTVVVSKLRCHCTRVWMRSCCLDRRSAKVTKTRGFLQCRFNGDDGCDVCCADMRLDQHFFEANCIVVSCRISCKA